MRYLGETLQCLRAGRVPYFSFSQMPFLINRNLDTYTGVHSPVTVEPFIHRMRACARRILALFGVVRLPQCSKPPDSAPHAQERARWLAPQAPRGYHAASPCCNRSWPMGRRWRCRPTAVPRSPQVATRSGGTRGRYGDTCTSLWGRVLRRAFGPTARTTRNACRGCWTSTRASSWSTFGTSSLASRCARWLTAAMR
eukprot:3161102-Prymnesium_polylepis.1